MLTSEQISEYLANGFLTVNDVFTDHEINEMYEAFSCDEIQKHFRVNPSGFGFHLLEITTMHPLFLQYSCHPKVIDLIRPLLGDNIQLQHSKSTVKMPGASKGTIFWHQDFAYLPHTNTSLLTVMICVVDFTMENGCMQMVKGSHKLGVLNHRDEHGQETANDCTEEDAWQLPHEVVNIMPKKGGISIHHSLTLHASGDNHSTEPRYSLAFTYRASDAYQLADKVWEDTGLAVSGKSNHMINVRLESMVIPILQNTKRNPLGFPFGTAYRQTGKAVAEGRLKSPFLSA